MRVPINLAAEPFRKNRALVVASAVVGVAMAAVLAMQVTIALSEREQMKDTREAIARLEDEIRSVGVEQASLEAALRRPDTTEVLERSVLLNTLLRRKGISWTRMFADLEHVMPHNVRLVSVRPQVSLRDEVQLDMLVGSSTGEPVIEFLKRLEDSTLFGSTAVESWLPPSPSEPLYRYRIRVSYGQKL